MIKLRIAVGAAMLAVTGAAVGGNVSATVGLVSDYDFRGITQTLNDPAFQMGLTYTSDIGVYYGVWGSNVDFNNGDVEPPGQVLFPGGPPTTRSGLRDLDRPSTELDVFAGYSGEKWVGYDIGVIYYTYPNGHNFAQPEAYAGITKGALSLKVWYSWDWASTGDPAVYTEGNINAPLAEGFSFLGHFGYSDTSDWNALGNYFDWSVGFGYSVNNLNLTMKYIDGSDLHTAPLAPQNLGRFVFGVSTALPWGK